MYVYIYIYIYTHTTFIHKQIYIYIYIYIHTLHLYITNIYIYIYIYVSIVVSSICYSRFSPRSRSSGPRFKSEGGRDCLLGGLAERFRSRRVFAGWTGTSPNGYPDLLLASSFRMCLDCEVLRGMFPWRTRYPLSRCRLRLSPFPFPFPSLQQGPSKHSSLSLSLYIS